MDFRLGSTFFSDDGALSGYYGLINRTAQEHAVDVSRFFSISKLPSDGIYVTNLSQTQLKQINLWKNARFRDNRFLGVDTLGILRRFLYKEESERDYVRFIAHILNNLYRLYVAFFEEDERFLKINPFGFKNQMRQRMFGFDPVMEDEKLAFSLKDSFTYFIQTKKMFKGDVFFSDFHINAKNVLDEIRTCMVPLDEEVEYLRFGEDVYVSRKEDLRQWLKDEKNLGIYRIFYKEADAEFMRVFNFSGGVNSKIKKEGGRKQVYLPERIWATNDEILEMIDYVDLNIVEGYRFLNSIRLDEHEIFSNYFKKIDDIFSVASYSSISVQLFILNFIFSIAVSYSKADEDGVNIFSPFIWSRSKKILFRIAWELNSEGTSVSGYGKDLIRFVYPDISYDPRAFLEEVLDIHIKYPCIYPFSWSLGELEMEDIQYVFKYLKQKEVLIDGLWKMKLLGTSEKKIELDNAIVDKLIAKMGQGNS